MRTKSTRKRTSTPTYFEIEITHEDVLADLLWPASIESTRRPSVDGAGYRADQ